jgi:pyridoxamine 5'-phosphate oxidase family protein
MSIFTDAELEFLTATRTARLATLSRSGSPQVKAVGFLVDAETGTLDVPGLDNPSTQKWRNVQRDGRVALLVDDGGGPGSRWPRSLEIRGRAEALPDVHPVTAFPGVRPGVIRIHPERIVVFGVEDDGPGSRDVHPVSAKRP